MLALFSLFLRADRETEHLTEELATRYEEIDLLYTLNDILGQALRLEDGLLLPRVRIRSGADGRAQPCCGAAFQIPSTRPSGSEKREKEPIPGTCCSSTMIFPPASVMRFR